MKKEKNMEVGTLVTITTTPDKFDLSAIEIKKGECFLNSYKVAKIYADVEIIEGFILIIDKDKKAKALPHIWNKADDIYFDVTNDIIWKNAEEQVNEIKYAELRRYVVQDFAIVRIFRFSENVYSKVKSINSHLKNQINGLSNCGNV